MFYNSKKLDDITGILKEALQQIGLTPLLDRVELYAAPNDPSYWLQLGIKLDSFDVQYSADRPFVDKVVQPIIDAVRYSPAVEEEKYELMHEIDSLKTKIVSLQQEISELQPYKTNYDLNFHMKHGNKC